MANDELGTDGFAENAKAMQESAKAVSKAIDALEKSGGFFSRVFGGLVENGVGMLADKVKYMRYVRAVEFADKVEKIHRARGVGEDTKPVAPKIALPIIENATLEDNDILHDLWAKLLANAMDPNLAMNINRVHVSLLKEMEAIDVHILNVVFTDKISNFSNEALSAVRFSKAKITQALNLPEQMIEISLLNLMRLGCIKPGIVTGGVSMGSMPITIYEGTTNFHLSDLGVSLCSAVSDYQSTNTASANS